MQRRTFLKGVAGASIVSVAGCSSHSGSSSSATTTGSQTTSGKYSLTLDETAWNWDKTNDVYWQLGKVYVTNPAAKDIENLAIYVPGAYLSATKNSNGTYTAKVNAKGTVGQYTASTAPFVFPSQTPGYAAQKPPTSYTYSDVSAHLKAGLIYVAAGMRGKDSNTSTRSDDAPWGVTDLKAAVRYIRYNADLLPGDKTKTFVFGMSGGGAQSALMGATGDSVLYQPYLESIGAAMTTPAGKTISDAVAGVMSWCPITALDYGNAAYEWNMGQFYPTGTRASSTWTSAYSADLAVAFADYINRLGLKDSSGKALTLTKSASGTYLAGSYYDYLISVLQKSLNDFLSDTTFPYTQITPPSGSSSGGSASGSGSAMPTGAIPTGAMPTGSSGSGSFGGTSTTYKTLADYIAHLNSATTWVQYDATTKTAKVLSLKGFAQSQKKASKDVGAFDGIARGAVENVVHGIGTTGLHFSPVAKSVIAQNESRYAKYSDWKSEYGAAAYTGDFSKTDSIGKDVDYRSSAYNPMYFISPYYQGYRRSTVAPHWRIRTGIMQPDTANTTEVNLLLALQNYGITDIDFATVWGKPHIEAERTGDADANFIAWVKKTAP